MDPNLIISIISIVLGAVVCFYGYGLKKFAFALLWFIVGFKLSTGILGIPEVASLFDGIDPMLIQFIPLAVGLLCSLIGTAIERAAIATLSFGLTMYLAITLMQTGIIPYNLMYFGLAIIIGAAVACVSVRFIKPAIIIFSAIIGAQEIATALLLLIPALNTIPAASMVLMIVLAILGSAFQFKHSKE